MSRSLKRAFTVITIFFVCLVAWLAFVTSTAISVGEPVMDEGYFRKGMNYQDRVSALERGSNEGWLLETTLTTPKIGKQIARIQLKNSRNQIMRDIDIQIKLNPSTSRRNQKVYQLSSKDAKRISESVHLFELPIEISGRGFWDLSMDAHVNGNADVVRLDKFEVK